MQDFKEFPKMIYKNGEQKIVESKEEQSQFSDWKEVPDEAQDSIKEAQSSADQKQDAQADEQAPSEIKDFSILNKSELIEMCNELNIETKGLSKNDLIKLLEAK